MIAKIQKWGNSQGLRFPREILRQAHVDVGDNVDISVEKGGIIVKPISVRRGKYRIRQLLSSAPRDYHPREVDWGRPSGKEAW
jgi:antitoxin MazE